MPTNDSNNDKRAFFAGLDALDDSDDNTGPDERRLRAIALLEHARSRKPHGFVPADVTSASNLVRQTETQEGSSRLSSIRSALEQHHETPTTVNTHNREIPTFKTRQQSTVETFAATKSTHTDITQTRKSSSPYCNEEKVIAMKRKRTTAANPVPEQHRIFSGLIFFFFPNNDISKARRLRISKAVEYGAAWAKDWSDEVSHVVVDKEVQFSELLKFLDSSDLPATAVSVNETYLSDCISYRSLLDPTQKRYEVLGAPNKDAVTPSPKETASAGPKSSLLPGRNAPAGLNSVSQTPRSVATSVSAENSKHIDATTIDSNSGRNSDFTLTTHSISDELHSMVSSGKGDIAMSTTSADPGHHRGLYLGLGPMAPHWRPANCEGPEGIVQTRELVSTSPRDDPDYNSHSESSSYNQQHVIDTDARTQHDEFHPTEHHVANYSHGGPHHAEPYDAQYERTQYDDALTAAIAEAKMLENIPLDLEDEDSSEDPLRSNSSNGETSDEEAQSRAKRPRKEWQENFQCMDKHDGSNRNTNPNARTIEVLEQMGHYYDRIDDHWRTIAYRKAVATLRKQTTKITTKEEALRLPFIGDRLAEKIQEIVWTNKLRRLDNTLVDSSDQVLQLFMQIYGVGLPQASRWVAAGFKTLDDLRNNAKLTENQKIGLAHFDDFHARIPRQEVQQHGSIVAQVLHEIDAAFEITIGGSYRRGADDSGDIDLIITKPDADLPFIRTIVLDQLVPTLFEKGFLKAALAKTHPETGTKWHGASALPGSNVWRRIDFLLVPWDQLGAALIYFTGNDIFNRSIRLLASKKGMRLNQRGLYRNVMRGKGRENITEGELVEGKSEKKIFKILSVPWRPPEHRIC